jgi:uncharacterized membrane protein YbhN (UPF0104 family)
MSTTELQIEKGSPPDLMPQDQPLARRAPSGKRWGFHFHILRIAVSVGLLTILALRTDWHRMGEAFRHLRVSLWFVALAIYLAAQLISGFRWQLLAAPLGFGGSLWRYSAFYFIGMFFNMMLPTSVGGDVVRAWYLDHRPGRRLNALLSVLADRGSGLLVLLLIACVAVAACPIVLPRWIVLGVWSTAAAALAGILFLPTLKRWTWRYNRVQRLSDSISIYRLHPWLLLGTGLLSVFVQAANVLIVCVLGLAIGIDIPAFYYWIFVPMVTLVTLLPVSLNGMGIREGSTVLFLAPLGVNSDAALCLSLLWFSVFTAASLLGGLVYLLGCYPRPEVQGEQ